MSFRVLEGDGEGPGPECVVIQRTAEGIEVNTGCSLETTSHLIAAAFVAWCLPRSINDER